MSKVIVEKPRVAYLVTGIVFLVIVAALIYLVLPVDFDQFKRNSQHEVLDYEFIFSDTERPKMKAKLADQRTVYISLRPKTIPKIPTEATLMAVYTADEWKLSSDLESFTYVVLILVLVFFSGIAIYMIHHYYAVKKRIQKIETSGIAVQGTFIALEETTDSKNKAINKLHWQYYDPKKELMFRYELFYPNEGMKNKVKNLSLGDSMEFYILENQPKVYAI